MNSRHRKKPRYHPGTIIALIITGLVGGYLCYASGRNSFRTSSSVADAATTTAVVEESGVEMDSHRTGSTGKGAQSSSSYSVEVTYSYSVDGIDYKSNNWYADQSGWGTADRAKAEAKAAEFQPGSEIVVHYSQGSPGKAWLLNESTSASYFIIWFGLSLVTIGYTVFWTVNLIRNAWVQFAPAAVWVAAALYSLIHAASLPVGMPTGTLIIVPVMLGCAAFLAAFPFMVRKKVGFTPPGAAT